MSAVLATLCLFLLGCSYAGPSFQGFLFVTWWTGTLQGNVSVPAFVRPVTIHGLWPQNFTGSCDYPSYCPGPQFNLTQLGLLIPLMLAAWPGYEEPSPSFWAHEWDKHGTCATSNEYAYFGAGLRLLLSLDPAAGLSAGGIIPGASYSPQQIVGALSAWRGVAPVITCAGYNTPWSGKNQATQSLQEIIFCLDVLMSPMGCPRCILEEGNCGLSVYVPVPQYQF